MRHIESHRLRFKMRIWNNHANLSEDRNHHRRKLGGRCTQKIYHGVLHYSCHNVRIFIPAVLNFAVDEIINAKARTSVLYVSSMECDEA